MALAGILSEIAVFMQSKWMEKLKANDTDVYKRQALDSVVSDIFGKSSTSIIDYLLEQSGTSINHEEIASKLLRNLKSKEDAVIAVSYTHLSSLLFYLGPMIPDLSAR